MWPYVPQRFWGCDVLILNPQTFFAAWALKRHMGHSFSVLSSKGLPMGSLPQFTNTLLKVHFHDTEKENSWLGSIHFWRRGIILYMSLNHSINMFKRGSSFQSLEKLQSKAGTWLSSQLWLDGALAGRALLEEKFCMELPDTSSTWGQHLQLFLVIRNELLLGVLGKLPRAQTGDAPLPWALVPLASVQNSSNVWL